MSSDITDIAPVHMVARAPRAARLCSGRVITDHHSSNRGWVNFEDSNYQRRSLRAIVDELAPLGHLEQLGPTGQPYHADSIANKMIR
jgi:hypothetical protein